MTETPDITKTLYRLAIVNAIADEMELDASVLLLGEDVGAAGGVFQATRGLFARFGGDRVIDTPISELALAGAAFGAAITGYRPIIEIMFGDFMFLPMDSLVNQSAKYWFLSNEAQSVPLVVRSAVGGGGGFGAIHSQIPAPWLLSVPGLKIYGPSNSNDAYWMLREAIRDPNPVVFLEHKALYGTAAVISESPDSVTGAGIVRPGRDLTIVASMATVPACLAAAEELAAEGIDAEVLDLRRIRPLDRSTILESTQRTGAVFAVEEGSMSGGWSADVLATVAEASEGRVAVLGRLNTPDLPLPFAAALEKSWLPGQSAIVAAVLAQLVGTEQGGRAL